MIIRDQSTKDRLAELYLAAGGSWVIETAERLDGTDHPNARMMQGAKRLAESIASMPALVIPTIIGRHDGSGRRHCFVDQRKQARVVLLERFAGGDRVAGVVGRDALADGIVGSRGILMAALGQDATQVPQALQRALCTSLRPSSGS